MNLHPEMNQSRFGDDAVPSGTVPSLRAAVRGGRRKGECEVNRWVRMAAAGGTALVVAVTLAACNQGGSGDAGTTETTPLQIGVIAPLTGSTASAGQAQACGALVAADVINKDAKSDGEKVEIHLEDSKGDPAEAARVAGSLTAEGIVYLGGGLTTSEVAAELPILADAGAITNAGTSQAQSILTGGAMVARLQPDTKVSGGFAADFISGDLGAKKVAMLSQDIEFSQELAKSVSDALGSGVEVQQQTVPFDEVNFASVIDTLLGTDPDVFFLPLAGFDKQVAFLRDYARTGTDVPLVVAPSVLSNTLVDAAGSDAEGVYGLDSWNTKVDNAASSAMIDAYAEFKGDHPECVDEQISVTAMLQYSSTLLYHDAALKAGTRDTAKVFQTIIDNTWDLPQGSLTFSPEGQAQAQMIVVQATGGAIDSVN